jgi:dTDP-4-amino-4,6-dideoxygalactose transaminase
VIRTKGCARDKLRDWLESNGVHCAIHYPLPVHLQPIYRKLFKFKRGTFKNSELASQTCLSLPMHPNLTREEIEFVSEKIHDFFAGLA